jgi:hypothetical protein
MAPLLYERTRLFPLQSALLELLAKHRLSDNVGGVKYFLHELVPALQGARHFALADAVALALPTRARS